jgi:acetyltransferase-like isoleucine patch superfamily enzyme
MIDSFFFCTTQLNVSDYVHIGPMCSVCGGAKSLLTMKSFSGMSAGVKIICASDDFSGGTGLRNPTIPDEFRCEIKRAPVILEEFCTVGANATILPGVTLARGSCVGANSLVTKSTKPWTMNFGSPARAMGMIPSNMILENARQLGYEFE